MPIALPARGVINSGEVSWCSIEGVVTTCLKGEVGIGDALNVAMYTCKTSGETWWSLSTIFDEPHAVVKES